MILKVFKYQILMSQLSIFQHYDKKRKKKIGYKSGVFSLRIIYIFFFNQKILCWDGIVVGELSCTSQGIWQLPDLYSLNPNGHPPHMSCDNHGFLQTLTECLLGEGGKNRYQMRINDPKVTLKRK